MWSKILAAECLSRTSLSKGGSLEKSISALICVLTTTALFSGCGGNQQFETVLSDETVSAGIDFWHDNGMSGELYFAETVGPGVALFDWDSDGDMDVAFSQGYLLKSSKSPEPTRLLTPPSGFESGFRLYRNDSLTSGAPKFTDITSQTGIQSRVYGMGLAITDFNRDGQPDVLITGLGEDEFWVSTDSGQYSNRAPELGINDDRWTTSAIFTDLDRDGDEDLYVCAYVDFSLDNHKPCFGPNSVVDYCGPSSFPSLPDRLYENMGSHALRDITSESGIGAVPGAGLGVVCSDLDQDGSMDLYVANDGEANRQWRQDSRLHFVDTALLSGCALLNRGGRGRGAGARVDRQEGRHRPHHLRRHRPLLARPASATAPACTCATKCSSVSRSPVKFGRPSNAASDTPAEVEHVHRHGGHDGGRDDARGLVAHERAQVAAARVRALGPRDDQGARRQHAAVGPARAAGARGAATSNTTTSFKSRAASLISAGTADPPNKTTQRSPYAAQAGEQRGVQTSPSTSCLDPASRNMVHCPAE